MTYEERPPYLTRAFTSLASLAQYSALLQAQWLEPNKRTSSKNQNAKTSTLSSHITGTDCAPIAVLWRPDSCSAFPNFGSVNRVWVQCKLIAPAGNGLPQQHSQQLDRQLSQPWASRLKAQPRGAER